MLEELGRQLLWAFYSSLSQPETVRPAQGPPLYRSHLPTGARARVCACADTHVSLSKWHAHSHTCEHTHRQTHLLSCKLAHRHMNTVWYADLPPSLKLMTVQVAAIRGVFMFFLSVKGPYEVSDVDKVERWAASHMSVYYESMRRPRRRIHRWIRRTSFASEQIFWRISWCKKNNPIEQRSSSGVLHAIQYVKRVQTNINYVCKGVGRSIMLIYSLS